MAISFPSNPNLNDTHVVGNVTWTWNGSSWTALAINTASDVNLTGDLIFEGATVDDFEATLTVTDPTADRTVTIPDATGEVVLRQEYGPGTNLYVDLLADTELYWGNTTNIEANDTSIIMKPGNSAVANFESGGLVISTTKTIKNLRNTNVYTTLRFDGTVNDPGNIIDIPKGDGVIPLVNSNGALELPTTNITGTKMESIKFSGTNFDSEIVITEPTAARTITLPDASGTVALLSDISGGGSNAITQGDSAVTVTDTGSDGNIEFKTENTARWDITSAGHLIPETNDTYDIGSAEFKVRDFYLSNNSLKFVDDTDPQNLVEYAFGVTNDYRLQFNGNSIKNTSAVDAVNAGAIDVAIANHFVTNGETYTLADGTYIGQELKFWRVAGAGYADITVANAIYTNGANTTVQAAAFVWRLGDASIGMYNCIWNGTAWVLSSGQPAV